MATGSTETRDPVRVRNARPRRLRHYVCVELRPGIVVKDSVIRRFVARHGIRRLQLYGSVLREDFGSGSDIDFLVDFEEGRVPGLLGLAQMELELEESVGRPVELRTYHDLSPYFRDDVVAQARLVYAA